VSVTPFRLSVVSHLKREVYIKMYRRGVRVENRDLYTPRKVEIETGVIERAEGSALVRLGQTQVLAGVKIDVGSPFRDSPDQGVLTVHSEFVPLASPLFEPGPPDENSIELARVVDRSLREVGAVDLESLVIRRGEKVWVVWVDLYVLDHAGNLFDASMLAAMAALLDARLPEYEELETGEIVVKRGSRGERLRINHVVVTVTTAKIGDFILVDPNLDEESISDVRVVTAFDERGRIAGMQKTGPGGLRVDEIEEIIKASRQASTVYFKALEEAGLIRVSEGVVSWGEQR